MKAFKTTDTAVVNDYPYGFKKTSVTFALDFSPRHGFRTKFTSTNPKTGKENKPKYSTYHDCAIMCQDECEKIGYKFFNPNSNEGLDAMCKFIHSNFDLFTSEQIEFLALVVIKCTKVSMYANTMYCGAEPKDLIPYYDKAVKTAVQIAKEGSNRFGDIKIDWAGVESVCIPDYQPFRVKSVSVIG
jgi:hypothetical protein